MSESPQQDDFGKLQALLALKRAEQPASDYHEDFLRRFQQRQRSELMRRSSLELLWDRIETWLGGGIRSRFALAGAASVCTLVALLAASGVKNLVQTPVADQAKPARQIQAVGHKEHQLPKAPPKLPNHLRAIRIESPAMPEVDLRNNERRQGKLIEF